MVEKENTEIRDFSPSRTTTEGLQAGSFESRKFSILPISGEGVGNW